MHICKNSLEIHCAMFVNIRILTFHTQTNMDEQTNVLLVDTVHRFFTVFLYPGHRNCHQDHTRNQSWRCHLACSKPCRKHEWVLSYTLPQTNISPENRPGPTRKFIIFIFQPSMLVSARVYARNMSGKWNFLWSGPFSGDMLIFGGVYKTNIGSQGGGCNNDVHHMFIHPMLFFQCEVT